MKLCLTFGKTFNRDKSETEYAVLCTGVFSLNNQISNLNHGGDLQSTQGR